MSLLKIKNGDNKFDNYEKDYIAPLKAADLIASQQGLTETGDEEVDVDGLLWEMGRKVRYAAKKIESLSLQIASKMESNLRAAKKAKDGELASFNSLGELQSLGSAYDVAVCDFCANEEFLLLYLKDKYSEYFEKGLY